MSKVITMIPVRLAATRLPNKPLLDINGKTLIQRVYENVKAAIDGDVCIACGDEAIKKEAEKFGAQCVLTDPNLPSGTDRIAVALKEIDPDGTKYDIAVNFQGDNINVDPAINNRLIKIIEETDCDIATCGMVFKTLKDAENPNNVKIVMGLEKGETQEQTAAREVLEEIVQPAISLPILSRPDPQEAVMSFFDALELQNYESFYGMLDGYDDLGLDQKPENAASRMVLGALKDSYAYQLEGEAELSGNTARQAVSLRSLDLSAVEEALRESARNVLAEIAGERPYKEICDADGYYLPSVMEEACSAAVSDVLARIRDFYRERELNLSLIYNSGSWYVEGSEELVNAILGK